MKVLKVIAFAVISCMPVVSNAQTGSSADYFPLEVGNSWTFVEIIEPPFSPPDTISQVTSTIVGTELINDTLYYAFDRGLIVSTRWRTDGQGKYWARVADQDQLTLDFNMAATDTISLFIGGDSFQYFNVTTSERQALSVAAGEFEDVKTVGFNAPDGWVDASPAAVFALDVGPIAKFGSSGGFEQLLTANVNGHFITSVEYAGEIPTSIETISPYPNPFISSTSFYLELRDGRMIPRIAVLNALGQQVDVLTPRKCTLSRCDFSWDAQGFPPGVYYFRPNSSAPKVISPVVLAR